MAVSWTAVPSQRLSAMQWNEKQCKLNEIQIQTSSIEKHLELQVQMQTSPNEKHDKQSKIQVQKCPKTNCQQFTSLSLTPRLFNRCRWLSLANSWLLASFRKDFTASWFPGYPSSFTMNLETRGKTSCLFFAKTSYLKNPSIAGKVRAFAESTGSGKAQHHQWKNQAIFGACIALR